MRIRLFIGAASIGLVLVLGITMKAKAAELKVLSAFGMQAAIEDLRPKFERASGHKLAVAFATGGGVLTRAQDGEPADVVITLRQGIDRLVKDGRVAATSVTVLAQAGIFIAVRTGAPKPDISSPDALKRTLLAARSISYVDPASGGASGIHFANVLERLGIAAEVKLKTVHPSPKTPAEVGALVANGEGEIGVHIVQELIPVPGIDLVGPLPADLQNNVVFAAAIMASGHNADAAKALIDFLRTSEAVAVIKAKGMEPLTQ